MFVREELNGTLIVIGKIDRSRPVMATSDGGCRT